MKIPLNLPLLSAILLIAISGCEKSNDPAGTNLSGGSTTVTTGLSQQDSLTARATITKLASLYAYNRNGGIGARLCYAQNALYIIGPAIEQGSVYKLDLTTNSISSYLNFNGNIVPTALDAVDGDPGYMVVCAELNGFNTYKAGNLTEQDYGYTSFQSSCNSLKYISNNQFIGTDVNNQIYRITNSVYNSGIIKSSNSASLLNSQLKGIQSNANLEIISNAMFGIGSQSKNIFVFANDALWQLSDNDSLKLIAGSPGNPGYQDGPGAAALFADSGSAMGNAIAVDANDNVFVADHGSGCIRKVDKNGNVTTVAGNIKYQGSNSLYTGAGNKICFHFSSSDMVLAPDGTSLYVIANNDSKTIESSNYNIPFALYKISFQ